MRSARALALIGAVGMLAGCASHASSAQDDPPVPVTLAVARSARFSSPIQISGTLAAVHSTTLGAAAAGRVVSVGVRVGDRVSPGELIAQIDASQYGAQLAGAQAGAQAAVESERAAQAQVAQAQSRLQLARVTAQRMSRLYREGAISRQQQDETQSNLAAAQAGLDQAQAGLSAAGGLAAQARAGVTAASVPLQDTSITAPYAGIVTQKFVEPGAVVGPGTPVAAIEDTSNLELDASLPDDQAAALVPGSRLQVRVDALGGAPVNARVRAIVPSQNPALRSSTVKIALEPRAGLLPGMFARVSVPGIARTGIGVPAAALVTRAGQDGVFTVRGGTASFVPVQPGASTDREVEVAGLRSGSQVAVTNLARLTDGARVAVRQ